MVVLVFFVGVGVSFGSVIGGCGGDSCWCYYITCNGGRNVSCRSALLKCILSCGGGSGSCVGGSVDDCVGNGVDGNCCCAGGSCVGCSERFRRGCNRDCRICGLVRSYIRVKVFGLLSLSPIYNSFIGHGESSRKYVLDAILDF